MTDIKTITIGKQEWMASNLEVNTFSNGDNIAEIESDEDWVRLSDDGIPVCCNPENDFENGFMYGKLYNWHAVSDQRGLAPEGFHIPIDEEWTELTKFLGQNVAVKLMSTNYWFEENGTNESGFNAVPSGIRTNDCGVAEFTDLGLQAFFWSSSHYTSQNAWYRSLGSQENGEVYRDGEGGLFGEGMSVRCLKN